MSNVAGARKKAGTKQRKKHPTKTVDDIDKIFESMDLNHDGRISIMELMQAQRLLGMNPTRKEAEKMIKECEPSQPGYVTKLEFKHLFKEYNTDMDQQIEEIKEAFQVFDKDNSGTITAEEIKNVLCKLDEPVDEAQIDEMMKMCDTDGDGFISIEEFATVMCEMND